MNHEKDIIPGRNVQIWASDVYVDQYPCIGRQFSSFTRRVNTPSYLIIILSTLLYRMYLAVEMIASKLEHISSSIVSVVQMSANYTPTISLGVCN